MSYWEANDLDVCTNQLLIDSFSVSCFTVSAQFLGPWVDWLKIGFWHERSALQSVAIRRSTGNDMSGPLFSFLGSVPASICDFVCVSPANF